LQETLGAQMEISIVRENFRSKISLNGMMILKIVAESQTEQF
jgi:hypothetical protein